MIKQPLSSTSWEPGYAQEGRGSRMTRHVSDSQRSLQQQMNGTQHETEQETLKDVLIIESFRQYLEQRILMQQKGDASVIGMTLSHPERAPDPLHAQWKRENAIARYLVYCFPERRVHVNYGLVEFDCLDEQDAENSLSLDTPALCWVTLFLQVSDAQAAGNDRCMSSITAAQGWALLEVVEDIVIRFVSH